MSQIVRKLIILPIILLAFASMAFADTDEDVKINGDLRNSILASIGDAAVVAFDLTSMDVHSTKSLLIRTLTIN